jgi:hypothetical protein
MQTSPKKTGDGHKSHLREIATFFSIFVLTRAQDIRLVMVTLALIRMYTLYIVYILLFFSME